MITGGAEKISNLQAMPCQRPSQQTNSVCKNELNVTNKPDTVHTSNGDPTITILETRDSDMNGKNNRNSIGILAYFIMCNSKILQVQSFLQKFINTQDLVA